MAEIWFKGNHGLEFDSLYTIIYSLNRPKSNTSCSWAQDGAGGK